MRRIATIAALAIGLLPVAALADDSVSDPPATVRVGEQFTLIVSVEAPEDAEVEINTAAESWGPVEVIRIDGHAVEPLGEGMARNIFTITVAAFAPGQFTFAAEAFITEGGITSEVRALPPATLTVPYTIDPRGVLRLSPIDEPGSIDGAQSPLLIPGIVAGTAAGVLLMALLLFLFLRWLIRRPRPAPEFAPPPQIGPALEGIESQLATDPVTAYRAMAISVRAALADQYGFPARALTTHELQRRMEAEGVDRWQSRLVRGLLDECDQVIYAGYRPALERRSADLDIARELLEGPA